MSLQKIILIPIIFTLVACSSSNYTLSPQAASVEFVDVKPDDSCQLLGMAEGSRSSLFSGTKTHSELVREAAIDLLNKAASMGGNTIYNAQDSTMKIVSDLIPSDITMNGEVYHCP